jgi:hypothetical protein
VAEQLRSELAGLKEAHEADLNRARREVTEVLTARHEAELQSARARAEGQVALAEAHAEGAAELAAAGAEEVARLVSQLAELRAGTPAAQQPGRSRPAAGQSPPSGS